ncbi:MAG: glycosyltransferase [Deltaproteobacteria bacterium]|nr:glycosyltransferase [Deltaproteobacteria bacterium]
MIWAIVLSVILPIRAEAGTSYLVERLAACLRRFERFEGVECIVVDSASAPPFTTRIRTLCDRPRVTRVEDPAPLYPFAPGVARNLGAQAARGDYLLFYDVDLVSDDAFIPQLERWCAANQDPCAFLMVPCLYVTRAATQRLSPDHVDLAPYLASYLAGENHLIDNIAVSTSTIVVSRSHFVRLGGNRPDYQGHGCEDFDLLHRLASYRPEGAKPADYYVDERTRFPADYHGFRAYLARYSLPHLFGGPLTAHLWHARPIVRKYFRQRQRNEALLQDNMRAHDAGRAIQQTLTSRIDAPALAALPAPWVTAKPSPPPMRDYLRDLLASAGRDPTVDIGLVRWKPGVAKLQGTRRGKLKKLITRPRQFFEDAKHPALRRLARLLRP